MSFIQDPRIAENIDTYRAGDLMSNVTITEQQRDAATALLSRHGALDDLGPMLGLTEVPA